MEKRCLQESIFLHVRVVLCAYHLGGFTVPVPSLEQLNENNLLFKTSSASVTGSLWFTASNVVLVKQLSSQRNTTSSGRSAAEETDEFLRSKDVAFYVNVSKWEKDKIEAVWQKSF